MENFDKERNLVQWNIADSVCKFQTKYWSRNENYRTAPIFNNAFFFKEEPRRREPDPGWIGTGILRREIRNDYSRKLLTLKMGSLFANDQLADFGTACRNLGIPLSQNEFLTLRTAAAFA
jgi:hypothetical protein